MCPQPNVAARVRFGDRDCADNSHPSSTHRYQLALWHSIIHGCVLKQLPELPTGCVSRTSSVGGWPGSVTAVITSVDSVRQERAGRGMGLRPPTVHPPGTNDARQRSSEISGVLYWGARHVPRRPHYIYCGPVALFRHCDELRMSTTATDCATR